MAREKHHANNATSRLNFPPGASSDLARGSPPLLPLPPSLPGRLFRPSPTPEFGHPTVPPSRWVFFWAAPISTTPDHLHRPRARRAYRLKCENAHTTNRPTGLNLSPEVSSDVARGSPPFCPSRLHSLGRFSGSPQRRNLVTRRFPRAVGCFFGRSPPLSQPLVHRRERCLTTGQGSRLSSANRITQPIKRAD